MNERLFCESELCMIEKEIVGEKYLFNQVQRRPLEYNEGNPSKQITHQIPVVNAGGTIQIDAHGSIVLMEVTETYVWNRNHRSMARTRKGRWSIDQDNEERLFCHCRQNGLVKQWKDKTCMGWNILFQNNKLQVLGKGLSQSGTLIDVKVCKFVEGNMGLWHGYPIDYRRRTEDTICDNALNYWLKMGVIDKSEIIDIKKREESSLI